MSDDILYEQQGGIATITLNRPATRNPISEAVMVDGLIAALQRADADASVRVAILTGAGSAFSSGGDIRRMQASLAQRKDAPIETSGYYKYGIQRIPLAFQNLDVPVIAAVNGPAMGAGCDLACMCDIRIAAESARFAQNFVKLGLVPGDGGAWFLPRVLGYSKACEMAYTGDIIDAQEALACGLVSQVVPDGELMVTAQNLAKRIAVNPPHAVRMAKRLISRGRDASLNALLELSASMQSLAHTSDNHKEAVEAFIEKRKPVFPHE